MTTNFNREPLARKDNAQMATGMLTRIVRGTLRKWLLVSALIAGPFILWASPASDARLAARGAMAAYKRAHPACEACGAQQTALRYIEVHHVVAVCVRPDLSGDVNNMIALCRPCHIAYGHAGDKSCRKYVPNVRAVLALREIVPCP
jgi:hypothetical protein